MRFIVLASVILVGSVSLAVAQPEVWQLREGQCGEWRSRLTVEQEQSGLWVGSADHVQIGGPCAPATGETRRDEIKATIAGDTLLAVRNAREGLCTYYGRIMDDRVQGVELCEGTPNRMAFALHLRSPTGQRSMRDNDPRQRDDFLDDPRTLDPNNQPSGLDLRFEGGRR